MPPYIEIGEEMDGTPMVAVWSNDHCDSGTLHGDFLNISEAMGFAKAYKLLTGAEISPASFREFEIERRRWHDAR